MVKLRSDFPKLNEDYYLTFLFSCLGFSVPTISLLLNKEKQTTETEVPRIQWGK